MKPSLTVSAVLLLSTAAAGMAQDATSFPIGSGTVVRVATQVEAELLLYRNDPFIEALSPFDRAARLMSDREIETKEFVEFVSRQVGKWQTSDFRALKRALTSVAKRLEGFNVPLPKEVLIVKTTGREEGNAAHCRKNAIVLPNQYFGRPGASFERLLLHELFHIYSRNLPEKKRDELYAILGFKRCSAIALPAALDSRRITNPDAPLIQHRLEVGHGGETISVVPFLYSSKPKYDPKDGGPFFKFLVFRLMAVEEKQGGWFPVMVDGRPLLLDSKKVPDFGRQIGENTGYVIHPEEVLADNFVLLVTGSKKVKTPRILADLGKFLERHAASAGQEKEKK